MPDRRTRRLRKALAAGDIEISPASKAQRLAPLSQANQSEADALTQRDVLLGAKLSDERNDVALRLSQCEDCHRLRVHARRQRAEEMEVWRALGLMVRFAASPLPSWAHGPALLALAGLDVLVFSSAAAVALDAAESWTDPGYLLGGAFGLVAFASGVLFARTLKLAKVARVQAAMIATPGSGVPADARPSLSHQGELVATMVLFTLFTVIGALIRYEGNPDERPSVIALQVLVPIVVVAVEYFAFDPTHVRVPSRGVRHRLLRRQVRAAQHRLDRHQVRADARLEDLQALHRTVEADYELELVERGFS